MRLIIIALITAVIDQGTKVLIQQLMRQGESVAVLPPVFYLTYIQNPGAAFGLFAYKTEFFIVITVAILAAIFWGQRYLSGSSILMRVGLGLIAGGALGNLIDRVRIGKVIDFFDFRIWPVFNLADTAIVVGAGLVIWGLWHMENNGKDVDADARR
ncbi:MAG: signal peptidase II [Bacillota bacterium]